jgi:hypothetical protein
MFKGYSDIGEPSFNEVLEDNLISYIDWGFLQLGAFTNIDIPASGVYGGDRCRLTCVQDPRYTAGRVWEAYRKNWVWQSGLNTSSQPVAISGIYVNNSFLPNSSGYYINYKNGQVIFDAAISASSTVKLSYSHKWVEVVGADSVPWFRKGQTRSHLTNSSYVANSGAWSDLADVRLQMPFIAVEVVDKDYEGYQLGGGQWVRTDVLLHIIAENSQTAKKIASILSEQNEGAIFLFDTGRMADNDSFPLDGYGRLVDGSLSYPNLIAATGDGGFRYTSKVSGGKLRIFDTREQSADELTENVYHSTVRWSTEVVVPKI